MKLHKGDEVKVLLGKDNGKLGKVLKILTKDSKALVEGVNVYKRHVRKMNQTEGGILDINKPVNISNLAVICPSCKKPTRIGYKIEDGTKVRVCKKCKEVIK